MKRAVALILLAIIWATAWPVAPATAQGDRPAFRPDAALGRLRHERGAVRARTDAATGAVRLLEGDLATGPANAALATARAFFGRYGDLFGLTRPDAELVLDRIDDDGRGYRSIRFSQRYSQIAVTGGDIRADVDGRGTLTSVHGGLVPYPRPSGLVPRLAAAAAQARAAVHIGVPSRVSRPAALTIQRRGPTDHLAWAFQLATDEPAIWHMVVDALDGTVLEQRDILATGKDIRTYDAQYSWNTSDLPGTLRRQSPAPPIGDPAIDIVHENAAQVYDYYSTRFRRDGLTGEGDPIVSSVHFGRAYNNAFWGNGQVVFGDGDGVLFGPLGHALDVVAHELTHGVTEYSARLNYAFEPGAINESYSDIFGVLIDPANWEIGEDVYTPAIAGDALRSLADPIRYGQPRVLGEYLDLPFFNDNGGVHVNSGILNHVAYLVAQRIGREKLAAVFYRTLTMKLTSRSSFADVGDLTAQACDELVMPRISPPITAADCRVIRALFVAAGFDMVRTPSSSHAAYLPQVTHGVAVCRPNAIRNGGFEAGQQDWPNRALDEGRVIGQWQPTTAGTWSARLLDNTQMLQLVERATAAPTLRLAFDIYKDASAEDETLEVRLEDPTTRAPLVPTRQVGASLAAGRWHRVTLDIDDFPVLSTFRLVFNRDSGLGAILIDSVLIAQGC